jgi:hypothetical protein
VFREKTYSETKNRIPLCDFLKYEKKKCKRLVKRANNIVMYGGEYLKELNSAARGMAHTLLVDGDGNPLSNSDVKPNDWTR